MIPVFCQLCLGHICPHHYAQGWFRALARLPLGKPLVSQRGPCQWNKSAVWESHDQVEDPLQPLHRSTHLCPAGFPLLVWRTPRFRSHHFSSYTSQREREWMGISLYSKLTKGTPTVESHKRVFIRFQICVVADCHFIPNLEPWSNWQCLKLQAKQC